MPIISLLPVGVATSSTPFPANVGSDTSQVTLEPVYTSLAGKAALSHTHAESDVTNLVADLSNRVVGLTTFAALPAASTAGKTYVFSDSPLLARDNGSSYDYFFLGLQVYPWDDTGFSWDNQGGASILTAGGIVFFSAPASTTSIRVRYETAPATPWTLTVLLRNLYFTIDGTHYAGIVLRDGSGKLYIFYISSSSAMQAIKFTNSTTFSAIGMTNGLISVGQWQWLRVADNGTNILFSVSVDGENFVQVGSEGRTVFFAAGPTQLGVFTNTDNGSVGLATTVYSYRKT